MEERLRFVIIAGKGTEVFCDLCKEYGISPKTGYKWLRRYKQWGAAGMKELSRRPHQSPSRTKAALEEKIVQMRRKRPKYGPKKLYELLVQEHGPQGLPAVSTIAKIIAKRGLAGKRGRRPRHGQIVRLDRPALTPASRPNEVWTVDFKGWFKTGDGCRCDPLTVTDLYSRFLICVKAVPAPTQRVVQRAFSGVFRKYGLPEAIRVDNGPPFASHGLAGLSKLSVWWTQLGIRVEFIRPASPQMNGSHERMHRTLKAETTQPASCNRRAQQRRFDRWRQRFNCERPHEAIAMRRPADLYQASSRRYTRRDKRIRYPKDYIVRPVSSSGFFRYGGTNYFAGEAFAGTLIGLNKNSAHETELYFANKLLGKLETQVQARFRPTASIGPAPESIPA